MNRFGDEFISFFRKNNKILLNVARLSLAESEFVLDRILFDVLFNVEVMLVHAKQYEQHKREFQSWNGNLIIYDENYVL